MRNKSISFYLAAMVLAGIILCSAVMTVKGQSRGADGEREAFCRSMEAELLGATRTMLQKEGFTNCGVTLNRITDEDGSMQYVFTIHHSRIDRMSESERKALAAHLEEQNKGMQNTESLGKITFRYDFLIL